MAKLGIAGRTRNSGVDVQQWLLRNIRDDVQNVGDSLIDTLKTKTPVDTGAARKGWRIRHLNDTFKVSNKEKHIGALNEGHSKQAKSGWVDRTIRNTQIK